ncbi:MAG TPA: hypothetical protein VH137_01315 [Gemmatimonadales bacterium]|nr:hypothetical protein [Gemmatimonadales bacterium]
MGAARLIGKYGALESFPPEVLGQRRELALLFKQLATLRTDSALFAEADALRWQGPTGRFEAWAERFASPRLLERAHNAAAGLRAPPAE